MTNVTSPSPSDEERQMLRDSLRGLLEAQWPAAEAVARSTNAEALGNIWGKLVAQGFSALGAEPAEGGLRELAIAAEELGRAACPAPLIEAGLVNLALSPARGHSAADAVAAAFLDRLHAGRVMPSFSFGALDPDRSAGSVKLANGKLDGKLRFVEGAAAATHLVVIVDGGRLAIVALDGPGVRIVATRALGTNGLAQVELSGAAAQAIQISPEIVGDLNLLARVCTAARAHGAARRAFELVVDYAKERQQFGQPIGRFQAIQHKLANCLIALEGAKLTIQNAAATYDQGIATWRFYASAAFAAAGSLRQVSLETHHTFGAIGYAEEHEAPRHFKRVHLDLVRYGGARRAREELSDYILGDVPRGLPEYDLGPSGNAFREEVRAWLEKNWSGERKEKHDSLPFKQRHYDEAFARDLGKTGWLGMYWPKSFGGQDRTPLERLAFKETMERVEAPRAGAPVQDVMLMLYGTPEQQQDLLPKILRGEVIFGMGYSEPNSGSDLASLRTRAVRDGDEWVINGQKIWTTTYWGNYMLLATRTDAEIKPPHAGLSLFIVPMDTPGITIRPATTMYDGAFANVFYDNVRLPASALVGKVNGGWEVLTGALATERGVIGADIITKLTHSFELLCDYIRQVEVGGVPLRLDPLVRDKIGELAAQIEIGRQMMLYCAVMAEGGNTPLHEAAMSKVFSGELMERFGEAALDILGMEATLSQDSAGAILRGRIEQNLRHSLMWVISLGTNEIQRNLIAQRGLRLPR
jgi:alkylation response protein AidB-like acyl-CoA dehydrogenase